MTNFDSFSPIGAADGQGLASRINGHRCALILASDTPQQQILGPFADLVIHSGRVEPVLLHRINRNRSDAK